MAIGRPPVSGANGHLEGREQDCTDTIRQAEARARVGANRQRIRPEWLDKRNRLRADQVAVGQQRTALLGAFGAREGATSRKPSAP